jgi:hypothetical protein
MLQQWPDFDQPSDQRHSVGIASVSANAVVGDTREYTWLRLVFLFDERPLL